MKHRKESEETKKRNLNIYKDYGRGMTISELSRKYQVSFAVASTAIEKVIDSLGKQEEPEEKKPKPKKPRNHNPNATPLKDLTLGKIDSICVKNNHVCENCPLFMENNTYGFKECAVNHSTWQIREEYREEEIEL